MDTGHGPEEHQEEYSFMQETFKDEQMSPRKVLTNIFKWIAFGLLFGCAACVSFFALKPWAEEAFMGEPEEVQISNEDESESNPSEDEEQTGELEEQEPDGGSAGEEQQQITQVIEKELTMDDYLLLNNEMKVIANEAQKCVVKVTGQEENNDWTVSTGIVSETSGLIVADNGRELLILANYSTMKATQIFQVEFADGSTHQATMKQKDANLDMAVYSVAKDSVEEETWESIEIAEFGSSNRAEQGRTLIAVGQPFGFENGIGFGVASSVNEAVTYADGEYQVLVTNMAFSGKGNGFLFDLYGKVIGYIDGKLNNSISAGTLVAYGISDITDEIEMMSNGKHVPYVGIVGTMVDESAAELYGIPVGLYVQEVENDSPAMKAGIQSGDVITAIGEETVLSLDVYHDLLYTLEAGQSVKFKGERYGTEEYVGIDFTVTIGIKE